MVRREPYIAIGLATLERSRLSTGWEVQPGEGNRAEEVAEFATHVFDNVTGTVRDLLHELLEGRWIGYSLIEKVPTVYDSGPYSGKWGFKAFRGLWQEEFSFGSDGYGNLTTLKQENYSTGSTVKDWTQPKIDQRFVVYVPDKEKGNWYGRSILRPLYRAYTSKDYLQRAANVAADRFGGGTISAILPEGAVPDSLGTVRDALQQHHGSPAHAFSHGTVFDISYPPGGAFDGFLSLIDAYNRDMLIGLGLPSTMFQGTGPEGAGGSLALSQTHSDNFAVVIDRIGRGLEDVIDEQIIRQLVEWNYPGVSVEEMPRFRFSPFRKDDQAARGELLKVAQELGVDLSRQQIREELTLEEPVDEEDVVTRPEPPPMVPGINPEDNPEAEPPEFAEGRALFDEQLRRVTKHEEKVDVRGLGARLEGMYAAAMDNVERAAAEVRDVALEVVEGADVE